MNLGTCTGLDGSIPTPSPRPCRTERVVPILDVAFKRKSELTRAASESYRTRVAFASGVTHLKMKRVISDEAENEDIDAKFLLVLSGSPVSNPAPVRG
jgi:hypothetical protein